jgi:sugar/nucleoside kinase (ribokinase family)
VGWIADRGSDFPAAIDAQIESWQTFCFARTDETRLTTRGWNGYDASENRAFKYTTPKLRLDAEAIASSPELLASKCFHLICSPDRCIDLVKTILIKRKPLGLPRPIFVWEPVPDLCIPSQLLATTRALPYVDVCSPNAAELGSLLGYHADEIESATGEVDPDFVEIATEQLLASMPLSSFAIVVRAGKSGCYLGKNGGRSSRPSCLEPAGAAEARQQAEDARRLAKEQKKQSNKPNKLTKTLTVNTLATPTPKVRPAHGRGGLTADTDMMALFAHLTSPVKSRFGGDTDDEDSDASTESDDTIKGDPDFGVSLWLPAYHTSSARVIDPTGGGNTFLGTMAIGLARGKGLEVSCRWAAVGASFAIEQVGMPLLGLDSKGNETWNGDSVERRLCEYETRLGIGLEEMRLD